HPIHIGVTEAGTLKHGQIKSAIGLGALLLEGIGDTMRVSLTADPVEEVYYAKEILKALKLKNSPINYVSCPTCGRTKINLEALAQEVEETMKPLEDEILLKKKEGITLAVMGCVVNGPGESKEADYGIAGGIGEGLIFKEGEIVGKYPENELANKLKEIIKRDLDEINN
ncbi:MAG: flavodoxin-dependent (E)-4-hydroxy-3-methylbut-2-enyl-diphosphate synthase, partial [Clostridia bacterium]|nr:flavodoxin-dependent (E)-4-hydroxy-3-methylbut-2-enyl-diphosphate synthase [Clostridia bacterium]